MRRLGGWLVIAGALLLGSAHVACAQTYPERPIRAIIPFPAGGAADVLARIVFEKAAGSLGQPFVVENVAGAGGNLGTNQVAKAEPDGYRIGLIPSGPLSANKTLSKNSGAGHAGVHLVGMVRAAGAERHAATDHRQAECGDRRCDQGPGHQQAPGRDRRRSGDVDEATKTMTYNVEMGSSPVWEKAVRKQTVSITGDVMTLTGSPVKLPQGDNVPINVFKRAT